MKKLLVIGLSLFLISCIGESTINSWDYDIITQSKVLDLDKNKCLFTTYGANVFVYDSYGQFVCNCNKFKVGDTIHIVKCK